MPVVIKSYLGECSARGISKMTWQFFILLISVGWYLCIVRSQYEPYGENVAYRKPANQSTTYIEGTFMYNASLGVDGRKSTTFANNECSHTDQSNYSWWTVNLDGFYFIKFIMIYQRTVKNRLNGTEMYVRLMDHTCQRIYFNSTLPPEVFNVSVKLDKAIGEIMLNISKPKDAFICVCELEAFEVIVCSNYSVGNGSINAVQYGDSNQTFTYGTKLNVTCHEGYRISDDGVVTNETESNLECNATGNWSRNLSCSVVVCRWPPHIPNNSKHTLTPGIAGNTTYNATLTVKCNEGYNYSLQETEPIRCAKDGFWDGELGNCNVIDCGQPLYVPGNSTITSSTGLAGNTSYNATLTILCNNGFNYTLPGNETIRCGIKGHWTSNLGLCEVIDCGWPLNIPGNSTVLLSTGLAGNTSYNATLTVRCNMGFNYTLPGNETIRCGNEGRWPDILGLCKVIECGLPPTSPSNSHPIATPGIDGNASYNATITVVCNEGYNYTSPGKETVRCGDDGVWETILGNCQLIDCGQPLHIPGNSTIISSNGLDGNTSYNATLTVRCNKGFNYTFAEKDTILCGKEGKWNAILGRCEAIQCGLRPTSPSNGVLITSPGIDGDASYNATMTVVCNEGYNYTYPGSETARCRDDGSWETIIGNCKAIECFIIFNIDNGEIKVKATGVDGKNNTYGVKLSVVCDSGFTSNVLEITCLDSGLSSQPVCSADRRPTDLTAAIVGSLVTFITVMALVIGIIIFMRRRKKHKDDATRKFDQIDESEVGGSSNPAAMDFEKDRLKKSQTFQEGDYTKTVSNGSERATETDGDNDCYENIQNMRTKEIKVENLFEFVLQRRSKSNLYEEEYKHATRSVAKSKDVAVQAENKGKNRYKGMVPYDDNRVILHVWDATMETDYINASFIDGFSRRQAYVAAQGPMENTLNDFWRMIWQLKTKKIVMLTNLIEGTGRKCMQYWPDEGTIDFGKINVQLIQTDQFSDFTIRTMKIKMNDAFEECRMIKQFHFTTWPDKSVPRHSSSMVHFRHKIHTTEVEGKCNGPLVVHCSAGVGRTGTFIAIDYLVDQAEAQRNVNVISCLESLRNQRVLMIQTLEQFIFVHEVLVEALTCTTSAVSARDFQEEYRKLLTREPKQKKTFLQLAFEKLQILIPNTDENIYAIAKETGNRDKNRYCNILPDENYRPYLSTHVNGRNSYINAVFLPAYKENDAFIITQTPLENTIVDFWRMVYQYDVSSIVMLNTLSQMKDNERYWPQKGNVFNCPPFEIHLESEETFGCCEVSKLILIYKEEQRNVRLSRASYWAEDERVPKSPVHVLEHVELVQGWQTESAGRNPIVVHCMNGAERSGLFCVITAVLERTKIEQDVAIEQIVRQLRHRRSQIIPDLEQFRFCHEAVIAYLNQYETYANF